MRGFSNIAFTPEVKALQARAGSRKAYARLDGQSGELDALGEDEIAFIGARDSFYMASVGSSGWPYVQHRGGPPGFVKVLDPRTLAFADRRGNRQYVTAGNVGRDDRVALIFVDYPNQARLKVYARVTIQSAAEAPDLLAQVADGRPAEAVFVLRIEGLDWNCPQYITPRFTEEEVMRMTRPLTLELEALRKENEALRLRAAALIERPLGVEDRPMSGETPIKKSWVARSRRG